MKWRKWSCAPVAAKMLFRPDNPAHDIELQGALFGLHGMEANGAGFYPIGDTVEVPWGENHPDDMCVGLEDEDGQVDRHWTREDDRKKTVGSCKPTYASAFVIRALELNGTPFDAATLERLGRNTTPEGAYIGQMKDGLPHGKGVFVYGGMSIHDGLWKQGRVVGAGAEAIGQMSTKPNMGELFMLCDRIFRSKWRGRRLAKAKYEVQEQPVQKNGTPRGEVVTHGYASVFEGNDAYDHKDARPRWEKFPLSNLAWCFFEEAATARTGNGFGGFTEDPWSAGADPHCSAWTTCHQFFPQHWVWRFETEPYYGGPKVAAVEGGPRPPARFRSLSRMRCNGPKCLVRDPCVGVHDEYKWGLLETMLLPGAMLSVEWRQDSRTVLSAPGKHGRYVGKFEMRNTKFAAVHGLWEVATTFATIWCPKLAAAAKAEPNVAVEVNNIQDEESAKAKALAAADVTEAKALAAEEALAAAPELAAGKEAAAADVTEVDGEAIPEWYPLRNKPGAAGRKAFQEYGGKNAKEAYENGWTSLEFDKDGYVLNLSMILWNKNHPTNEWLLKTATQPNNTRTPVTVLPLTEGQLQHNEDHPVGSGDGDEKVTHVWRTAETAYGSKAKDLSFATLNDGQVMSSVVHAPTRAFMNRTCCPDQLQAVRDRGPGMWLQFMTGCLDPGSPDYGDCIMEAVVGVGDCDMPDLR